MPPLNCHLDNCLLVRALACLSVEVHTVNEVMSTCVTTASTACAESMVPPGNGYHHQDARLELLVRAAPLAHTRLGHVQ